MSIENPTVLCLVNVGPVHDMIFYFQGIGMVLNLVAHQHHVPSLEDFNIEQANQADALDFIRNIVNGEVALLRQMAILALNQVVVLAACFATCLVTGLASCMLYLSLVNQLSQFHHQP